MKKVFMVFALAMALSISLHAQVTITVSPSPATVKLGATQQFTATVTGTTNTAVTWTRESFGNASVSSSGLFTAPAPFGVVTARSVADPTKSYSVKITFVGSSTLKPVAKVK